jgi:signal peptidase I
MSLTILLIAVFLGLLILQVFLWAVFLLLGLRWAGAAGVATRRVVVTTAVVVSAELVLNLLFRRHTPSSDAQAILLGLLAVAATVLVPCAVIARVFKLGLLRSLQAWLPTVLPELAMILFAFLVLRPYICEAFVTPTNAMAPTLLGNHWRGTCPVCGRPNFCSPVDSRYASPDPPRMICGNFHVRRASDSRSQVFPGDRFLAAKFLAPRRWDVVVFQYPEDPSTLYVMRLVGLPGETVHIERGAVWIDGKELEPPDSLRGIQYLSELADCPFELWATKDRPAVLGEDEYFVLGDFSPQAKDSRLWGQGAPGHNPFAVPKSQVRGTVTHIYWPPERWRILR